MKQRTRPGAARRSITALALGLALLLSGSSMPSDPESSLPPMSGTSANLSGALAIDSNQGPSWGWAVDYETVQAASQSALARCGVQSCQVVMTFTNQCGAFAADQTRGSTLYGWGRGARPVINVGFNDVQGYVRWLSRETGQPYRLLSEAEWEYVARAGTESARHWGQSADAQCRYANGFDQDLARTEEGREMIRSREESIEKYSSSTNPIDPIVPASCSDGYGPTTAPAGSFEPNGFELFDVLGNVSEWTEDCWHDDYVGAPSDGSPWIAEDCRERVVHGGGWSTDREEMYSARRWVGFHFPDDPGSNYRSSTNGFRVARSLQ